MAVLEGATVGEIEGRMDVYLDSANINTKTIVYTINGTEVADPTTVANFGDAIGVEIRVNFDDVSWIPIPQYIGGKILRATSFMRRETSQPL